MSVSTKGRAQSESKLTENDEKISVIVNRKKIEIYVVRHPVKSSGKQNQSPSAL